MTIQEKNHSDILTYLNNPQLVLQESDENSGTIKRIDIKHGKHACTVKVFKTGTIQIQGADSDIKKQLEEIKSKLEKGEPIVQELPLDIERFPHLLVEKIPNIDPTIITFISESLICLKAGSLCGATFLIGAASEKAIFLLVDTFENAIADPTQKTGFNQRKGGNNGKISKAFDAFKASYKSCNPKPSGFDTREMEIKIDALFQFYRLCRNEIGHPVMPPNLEKSIIVATLGQFTKYIETIYDLIRFYQQNTVTL